MSSNAGVNQERICSPPSAPVTKSPSQPQSPPPKAQPKTQPHAGNVDTEAPKNQEKSSLQREKQDRVKHEKRERRKAEKQEKEKQEKEKQEKEKQEKEKQEKEKQEKEKQEKEKQEKEKQEKEKPTSQERQQRRQQEFSSGTSKARGEARNLQTSKSAEQDRPHQRSGEKSGPVPTPGTVSGGKKEKQRPEQSLFVEHIITNYPLLTVTCNEVNNRLPIKIPNPNDLPLFSRLPSIASFPVLSTIDQTLNGILNRIDSAFPVLKSDPEHLVHQVAEITDPWIAPANTWLVDHLPTSKESARKDSSRRRQRRKEQGKKWSEQKAPGEKSFADTVAENNGGSSSSSEDNAEAKGQKPSEQEKDQKKDQQQQIDMELLKTVAIFQGALQAQLDRADNARGYIAEVILPGYVPLVGGWLGDKVAGREKKRVRGGKKSGKKTGEEERKGRRLGEQAQGEEGDRERGEKVLREGKNGEKVAKVGGEERRAEEGATVIGGREL